MVQELLYFFQIIFPLYFPYLWKYGKPFYFLLWKDFFSFFFSKSKYNNKVSVLNSKKNTFLRLHGFVKKLLVIFSEM